MKKYLKVIATLCILSMSLTMLTGCEKGKKKKQEAPAPDALEEVEINNTEVSDDLGFTLEDPDDPGFDDVSMNEPDLFDEEGYDLALGLDGADQGVDMEFDTPDGVEADGDVVDVAASLSSEMQDSDFNIPIEGETKESEEVVSLPKSTESTKLPNTGIFLEDD